MKRFLKVFLFVLLVPFLFINVYAEETDSVEVSVEDVYSVIPDDFSLDIKESEAISRTHDVLYSTIMSILSENSINLSEIHYGLSIFPINPIYEWGVYFFSTTGEATDVPRMKLVQVTYSNSSEKIVENQEIVDHAVDGLEQLTFSSSFLLDELDNVDSIFELSYINSCIREAISDERISFKFYGIGMDGSYFSGGLSGTTFFFVDDVLYQSLPTEIVFSTKVMVPYYVENVDEYLLQIVREFLVSKNVEIVGSLRYEDQSIYDESEYGYFGDVLYEMGVGQDIGENILVEEVYKEVVVEVLQDDKAADVVDDLSALAVNNGYADKYRVYEITSSDDVSSGIHLMFQFDEDRNGQNVLVIHKKKDESYEFFQGVVSSNKFLVTVYELSPFGVFFQIKDTTVVQDVSNVVSASPVVVQKMVLESEEESENTEIVESEPKDDQKIKKVDEDADEPEEAEDERSSNLGVIVAIIIALLGVGYFIYMGSKE